MKKLVVILFACVCFGVNLVDDVYAGGGVFSDLPVMEQYRLRDMVRTPRTADRYGCYSVPMYFLFYEGYDYDGSLDADANNRRSKKMKGHPGTDFGDWKLKRNRPDWQEVLIRDWVELGLNNTHFLVYPQSEDMTLTNNYRRAMEDFVRLSDEYGLKVGVRLDPITRGSYAYWAMNPDNPENLTDEYLPWVKKIASILKGKTAYYVLGDEMKLHKDEPGLSPEKWTPEKYLGYFKRVSGEIKKADPDAKVSMFAAVPSGWYNILYLLDIGYADVADGVAINYTRYNDVGRLFDDAAKLVPELMFLSNGVGYCSSGMAYPRYPQGDGYYRYPSDDTQGMAIAKNMFAWWDLKADTAPYYLYLRSWKIRDKVYPGWYGFFGFADLIVDEYDNLSIKRYPGWYAYQTVAHTFYNRDDFKKPGFEVNASEELSMFRVYEHKLPQGSELVMMLWNDPKEVSVEIMIGSEKYSRPVRINLFNHDDWSDVPAFVGDGTVRVKTEIGLEPVIIRLFSSSKP